MSTVERTPEELEKNAIMKAMQVGKVYFVLTATYHYVGRVVSMPGDYTVILEDASWVAFSGRLSDFIEEGESEGMESEFIGTCGVNWLAWIEFPHEPFDTCYPKR